MAANRANHDGQRESGPKWRRLGREQKKRSDELDHAGSQSPPGLRAQRAEDVDRLLGPGELEEQRLEQNASHNELEGPADDCLELRNVIHARLDDAPSRVVSPASAKATAGKRVVAVSLRLKPRIRVGIQRMSCTSRLKPRAWTRPAAG